jgi:nitroreductase
MAVRLFPFLRKKMQFFADRLNATAERGLPALTEGSFYIVAAEKKGFPPIAEQSLAHVMENMWLTATAHGVGFQMLSVTNSLAKNTQFMNLLGLPPKGWALTGSMIGNPKQQPKGMRERSTDQFIRWIE